jgi:hypothetical protein
MTEEIKEAFEALDRHKANMLPRQAAFVDSLKKYFTKEKRLSEAQMTILFSIRRHVVEML